VRPVFIHLPRNIDPRPQVEFHAVALANGRPNVKNPKGNDLATDDRRIASARMLTLPHRP